MAINGKIKLKKNPKISNEGKNEERDFAIMMQASGIQ